MTTELMCGDALSVLKTLPDEIAHTCVTSPPYWGLRDYGITGQLGLEPTPELYVEHLVQIFREVRRVLREDGTLWLNLGDSYCGYKGENYCVRPESSNLQKKSAVPRAHNIGTPQTSGLKPKDLVGIPWMAAFALRSDGWYLRSDIIWSKPNPMPESVKDRPTKSHEYIFLLSKSDRYFYDAGAIQEPAIQSSGGWQSRARKGLSTIGTNSYINPDRNDGGGCVGPNRAGETRNRRSVWTVTTKPYKGAHFATFPPQLIEPCILAGSPIGGLVLDPFNGAGTTGVVATQHGRNYIGIDLNPDYIEMARKRIEAALPKPQPQQKLFAG